MRSCEWIPISHIGAICRKCRPTVPVNVFNGLGGTSGTVSKKTAEICRLWRPTAPSKPPRAAYSMAETPDLSNPSICPARRACGAGGCVARPGGDGAAEVLRPSWRGCGEGRGAFRNTLGFPGRLARHRASRARCGGGGMAECVSASRARGTADICRWFRVRRELPPSLPPTACGMSTKNPPASLRGGWGCGCGCGYARRLNASLALADHSART